MMIRRFRSLIAATALALAFSGMAHAANTAVLRVITVKSDNVAAYIQELDKGKAMMKKLGISSTLRVWRATFAGPNAGTVVVTQEYASLTALADANAKTAADPEFSKWLAALDKVRTITSDSLYREL
jgi:hypothetical protein